MPERLPAFRFQSLLFSLTGILLISIIFAFYSRQYGWFEPRLKIYVTVPSSQGLRIGSPVRLSGMRVGVLEDMRLVSDGRVRLELRLPDRYRRWISPRSVARIGRDGVFGDWSVEFSAAPMAPERVPSTLTLPAQTSPGLDDLLARVESTRADLQKLLVSSSKVADREVPATLKQFRGTLAAGQAVSNGIDRELSPTARQVRTSLQAAEQTARSAALASDTANQTLQAIRPDLVVALREISSVMRRTNLLLRQFGGASVLPQDDSDSSAAPVKPEAPASLAPPLP